MDYISWDYISCILTVLSTVLVGRRRWEGLALAVVNSVLICVLARNARQYGLIPANLFCMAINVWNMNAWRKQQAGLLPFAKPRMLRNRLGRLLPSISGLV